MMSSKKTITLRPSGLETLYYHVTAASAPVAERQHACVAAPGEAPANREAWEAGALTGASILRHPSLKRHVAQLPQRVVAIQLDGVVYDLMTPIETDAALKLISITDALALPIYRHTAAHVMAYAIKKLFPDVQLAIGPPIDNGFYYDFDNVTLKNEDFTAIEKEMRRIIKQPYKNERYELSRSAALAKFKDEPYKLEIIEALPAAATISYYKMGDFSDLCKGPHLPGIANIKGFKLARLAGAYWRGNEKNKMLTRLYAHCFRDEETLKTYTKELAERERYEHNKVGRELGLFISDPMVGQGLPLMTPKGTLVKQLLQSWVENEERKRGYQHTLTPLMAKSELYKVSGHWDHYQDSMFIIHSGTEDFALRPMTCPFHFALYNNDRHSYKELPIRYAETSILFRNEASGEMHGLTRVRQFTLSDGHIICRPDQVEAEFKACLDLLLYFLKTLDIKAYSFRLSKWDPQKAGSKFIDNPAMWEQTEAQMYAILVKCNIDFVEAVGEAAFYGPKLDVQTKNVHGKEDTLLTVQIDFALPERFKMTYIDADDKKQQPVVIHRASIGCYERTLALLLEHHRGNLPFWLAPEQISLIPIHAKLRVYTETLKEELEQAGLRVHIADRDESLAKRIKWAQQTRIPYIAVIGDKEQATQTLSIRTRNHQQYHKVKRQLFLKACAAMVRERTAHCLLENFLQAANTPSIQTL